MNRTKAPASKSATTSNGHQAKSRPSALAPIKADEIYPIETFRSRTGLGVWAIRQMRRAGLRTHRVGGRCFILGTDFRNFLSREEETKEEETKLDP